MYENEKEASSCGQAADVDEEDGDHDESPPSKRSKQEIVEKRYRCRRDPQCTKSYTSSFRQKEHEKTAHPLPGEKKQCHTCNKVLFGDKKFQTHVDVVKYAHLLQGCKKRAKRCTKGRLGRLQRWSGRTSDNSHSLVDVANDGDAGASCLVSGR
jgi:hypothetical protein